MNFFCRSAEFDQYVEDMGLNKDLIIKADIHRAVVEGRAFFLVADSAEEYERFGL